jgi:hypothetical protein
MNIERLLFKVIDPSGKVYEIFATGRISGFPDDSIVINHFPALLAYESITSSASAVPTRSATESFLGGAQSLEEPKNAENISVALGEK